MCCCFRAAWFPAIKGEHAFKPALGLGEIVVLGLLLGVVRDPGLDRLFYLVNVQVENGDDLVQSILTGDNFHLRYANPKDLGDETEKLVIGLGLRLARSDPYSQRPIRTDTSDFRSA